MKRLEGAKYVFNPEDKQTFNWGIVVKDGFIQKMTTVYKKLNPPLVQFMILLTEDVGSKKVHNYHLYQTRNLKDIFIKDSGKSVWKQQPQSN